VKLFEYEAKEFLKGNQIPVPEGSVCENEDEAKKAFNYFGGNAVFKAQVLAGGRGKAGGILFPKNSQDAGEMGKRLLGMEIKGEPVKKILVEKTLDIEKEYYLGIVIDRAQECPLLMFSSEGGMEIEILAKEKPESIKKIWINPFLGLKEYQLRYILKEAEIPPEHHDPMIRIAIALFNTYWEMDGELIEINPLVITKDKKVFAADAKFNIDNNALYRQTKVPKRIPETVEERAAAGSLGFVSLDGDIGIMCNGAGLAMSTMDQLFLLGGKPANFLDGKDTIFTGGFKKGLDFILENKKVKVVLINIFTGGGRCDVIAKDIVETIQEMEKQKNLDIPIVATLHGRNEEEGRKILSQCKSPHLYQILEIEDAVNMAVNLGARTR